MAAVPLNNYPRRERKLAQFGREFVFSQSAAAAAAPPPGTSRRMHRGGRRGGPAAAAGRGSTPLGSIDSSGSGDEVEPQPQPEQQLLVAVVAAAGEEPGLGRTVPSIPIPILGKSLPPPRAWTPMQPWVEECLAFAAAYPRVAGEETHRQFALACHS